jgi:hypothetical protein
MAYAQFDLVQAVDYNNLVNGDPAGSPKPLNLTWGTGAGSAGYGQTAEANVAVGETVTASKWAGLVNKTANVASHQGSSITNVTAPVTGGIVTFLSAIPGTQEIPGNLNTIHSNRLNALAQSSPGSTTATRTENWSNSVTFVFTATFSNGPDAARYFFNAGGQLKITVSHSDTSNPQNQIANTLASNMGTIVISAMSGSATATIATVPYTGVTRIDGTGTPEILDTTSGYYSLSTAIDPKIIFRQKISGGTYNNSLIEVGIASNGTQGSNGDAGSVLTIGSRINIDPDDAVLSGSTSSTLLVVYPSTTFIDNTWGTVDVTTQVIVE